MTTAILWLLFVTFFTYLMADATYPPTKPALPPNVPQPLTPATNKKKLIWIGVGVAALLVVAIGGYAMLRPDGASDGESVFGNLPFAQDREAEPAKNYSGLSGVVCDHPDRRPIGVMLAGDVINRPLSGASQADIMLEMPALISNVTRLMGIYQCSEPREIGSVRSARHDYLFMSEGWDAILGHWGGSYHALNRIAVGEFQTINALVNPHNSYFRKNTLPAPYNGFTSYERLWNALQKLGYRTTSDRRPYEFKDDIPVDQRIAGGTLAIGWPGAFKVHYEYNPVYNRYERYWGGIKQIDAADNKTVAPSAVIIMRAPNRLAEGEGGYNEVGVEGTGVAEIYQDGQVIKGTWKKNQLDPKDPVHFNNDQGQPIIFTRGQLWIMTPDPSISVTWEPAAAPATSPVP